MALTVTEIQQLYTAYLGRPVDREGLEYWQEQGVTAAELRANLANDAQPEYVELYGDRTRAELVEAIYLNMFGREPDEAGLEYWVNGDGAAVPASELQQLFIDAASPADRSEFNQRVQNDIDDIEPEPGVPGETFMLTPNADRGEEFVGTENNDTFIAPIGTVNFANGNTLNSGDRLDGNGGTNTLEAELINDGFFQSGLGAVRPSTENVQNIVVNAIETSGSGIVDQMGGAGNTVTLNAANMYDVVNVWSKDSNANLVIQDITTKTKNSDGSIIARNTEALTFRMDHTSNANTGTSNQSDMTVYFDENYLLAGESSEFTIELRIVNPLTLANDAEPLEGFTTVTFSVGDEEVFVDISAETTYAGIASAINAELAERGISTVTATVQPERSAIFTDDVQQYSQGDLAGSYNPVLITSTDRPLDTGPVTESSDVEDMNTFNTWVRDSSTDNNPITTNVELHKAGRGDNGGDFHVGGKAGGSIEVFNVAVLGAEEKPSNIGSLTTGMNQGGMDVVNIFTHQDFVNGETVASLTIRDGFDNNQGLVSSVNANDFLGDLTIGNGSFVENVADFSATGGGNISYFADYLTTLDHTITTGDGNDLIDVMLGRASSGSEESKTSVDITSTGGDNTIILSTDDANDIINPATVSTGAGNDTITGGGNSLTVSSGAGNDVIYAENTGAKTTATLAAPGEDNAFLNSDDGVSLVEVLHNRDVMVTLQFPGDHDGVDSFNHGIERTVTVQARNGVITDARDVYMAVAELINTDRVFSSLAEASVTSEGELVVNYKVDGETVSGDELVSIETRDAANVTSSDFNSNLVNALREKYSDSTIDAGSLANAYSNASAEATVVTEGSNSFTNGENIVNVGRGSDVIVLSSNDDTIDTLVFEANGNFGNNTIVHFNDGEAGDVLDFTAWLNNEVSSSSSTVSRDRVETELGLQANGVHIIGFDDLTSSTTNFNSLTEAQVANGIEAFSAGNVVGSTAKAIVMVESGNSGIYNVYEVASDGEDNQASLVGVLDFGESQDFTIDNFA